MHAKPQPNSESCNREVRDLRLRDFISSSVERLDGGLDDILVIARSPETIGPRVLLSLSAALAQRRVAARMVFAGVPDVGIGETWQISFDPGFAHELRILRDCRYLDGHEQIVIGGRHVWFGDSMRREPDKRDAFSSFVTDNASEAGKSRMTFERIWRAGERIYTNPESGDGVSAANSGGLPQSMARRSLETLAVWRPLNRH